MGDYDDDGPDNTLNPSESLDSDEVRNDDGDIVVDPPEKWIDVDDDETLDEKLAEEEPEVWDERDPGSDSDSDSQRPARRTYGQIDGTPEDGTSFYDVVDDDDPEAAKR